MSERFASLLFQHTHRSLRRYAQRLWYWPLDLFDRLRSREDRLLPPRGRRFDGAAAFEQVGQQMLGFFRDLAHLQPNHRVLDLGCGIGRIAIPLTDFLDPSVGYTGLDINRSDIAWCQRHITPRFPHFRFVHADVQSTEYHRGGRLDASSYLLPFDDARFDFVCAISLFTHLKEDAAVNYAREISRVLTPGGRCFITFFLINQQSRAAVAEGRTGLAFKPYRGAAWVHDGQNPEAAMAFEESAVIAALRNVGLQVEHKAPGFWADLEGAPSYQDMIVAIKKPNQSTGS